MKMVKVERNLVVILFVLVLMAFLYAERDSRQLDQLYTGIQEQAKALLAKTEL